MPYPDIAVGQVWQSRDDQYEFGRQVRVVSFHARRVLVITVANPARPHRVGSEATFQESNLQKRWRLVEALP